MGRARYASTIVLARPEESGGFEILLTRRPRQMRFLGGFYVFPGGSVHREDYDRRVLSRCRGLTPERACELLDGNLAPELALGHWVAGVRELFEEVGVLLCSTESGDEIDLRDEAVRDALEQKRRALVQGAIDFATFLESERLVCDLSRPVYFYHRVTPEIYPIRFDTRFYLAPVPLNQHPLARSEEVTESLWIKPEQALRRAHRDGLPLIPPTSTVLEDLARIPGWQNLRRQYRLD